MIEKPLTVDTLPTRLTNAKYAMHGEVDAAVERMQRDLNEGRRFKAPQIVRCHIGNPHALKQPPITFYRQVLACMQYPELISLCSFPKDVIARVQRYSKAIKMGSYSSGIGPDMIRKEVATFVEARDGFACDPDDIYLSGGASPAIRFAIQSLIRSSADGLMIPIPQYPLYSATLTLFGGQQVGYYLDEENGWGLDDRELRRALNQARQAKINVRGLVLINPSNPTGTCLSEKQLQFIIDFCYRERLVLLADEVYQENIYDEDMPFVSCKKALRKMGKKYDSFQLISFHSVSKGFMGECGQRGGWMELVGIDRDVKVKLRQITSLALANNSTGQVLVGLKCNPPKPGDESYALFSRERNAILDSLKRRAHKVVKAFSSMKGIQCRAIHGAMYAFPRLLLPLAFIREAENDCDCESGEEEEEGEKDEEKNTQQQQQQRQHKKLVKKTKMKADVYYCLKLVEETGIVCIPGSGFGQKEGTYHLRMTILPPDEELDRVLTRFKHFHESLIEQYSQRQHRESRHRPRPRECIHTHTNSSTSLFSISSSSSSSSSSPFSSSSLLSLSPSITSTTSASSVSFSESRQRLVRSKL
eukprot:TRINITY_DN247_c2_g1_i1.p1 TRINITY_DN247_c2_g1~~TRINITY_DN247_c2_g1_i1.p1  ORF type:complete len:588 (+),score=134.24 TRINITY_DN247_c2_g1_i1:54-1817(+)